MPQPGIPAAELPAPGTLSTAPHPTARSGTENAIALRISEGPQCRLSKGCGIVMHRAIKEELDAVRLSACDRKCDSALHGTAGSYACLNRGAGKRDEVGNLPAVERQFQNSLIFDDRSDARGSRLDLSGVRLNFDLFA